MANWQGILASQRGTMEDSYTSKGHILPCTSNDHTALFCSTAAVRHSSSVALNSFLRHRCPGKSVVSIPQCITWIQGECSIQLPQNAFCWLAAIHPGNSCHSVTISCSPCLPLHQSLCHQWVLHDFILSSGLLIKIEMGSCLPALSGDGDPWSYFPTNSPFLPCY